MCRKTIDSYILISAAFIAFGFLLCTGVQAGNMAITGIFPANNAVEICADTKLWITFSTAPTVATSGTLQICKASDNSTVYQLNLYSLPNPPVSTGWPYQINLNGRTINYQPFAVDGNTLEIYPSTRMDYNTAYYVKMTAGFCADANGNTSPEINDSTAWHFTTKAAAPAADHDYMVALDGSGDFCTLQGAVDAVNSSDPCRTLIKIKKGTYRELVNIPSGKDNITWLGEGNDVTIAAAYNRDAFNSGSDARSMIRCAANGFRAYNMTYQNTAPDNSGQAETIKHLGLQSIVKNCGFKSYQDTLCLNGQMYLNNCYIEGDTDYIWGSGTVYFDKCEMHCMSTQSYITQPRTAQDVNGFFMVDCNLTGPPGLAGCYLGRTTNNSYPYCQSVFINCILQKSMIMGVGWTVYMDVNTDTSHLRWWEYKSVDPCGNLIGTRARASYSKQLDDANALYWRDVNNIFGTWNPKALGELPTPSWDLQPADGTTGVSPGGVALKWAAGAEAVSHMVYFGTANPPDFACEQSGTSFATDVLFPNTTYYWRVDENDTSGQTSGIVYSFTTSSYGCSGQIASDLDNDCEVDFFDYAILAEAWTDGLTAIAQFAADWLICNREPASECWQ